MAGATFKCEASGSGTFAAKEEMKSWGFIWDADKKTWMRACVDQAERTLFERNARDGTWPDVVLQFTEEARESWEDDVYYFLAT